MKGNAKQSLSRTIREAIDSYRGGLCFSEKNGKPILVNNTMNRLVYMLTGHTIINAGDTWEELSGMDSESLEMNGTVTSGESSVFKMKDGTVWQFRKQILETENGMGVLQFEASDVTNLYRMSIELRENNLRLEKMMRRQQEMLETIVRTNNEKELLSAKMRIHDEFGRCLVATKKAIQSNKVTDKEYLRILDGWSEAVRGMKNVSKKTENSSEEELNKVADLIGCKLVFKGEKPNDRRIQLLVYASIREALTNAVRHSSASELTTEYLYEGDGLKVVITNNGKQPEGNISEGGGLTNLRKSLENSGALLDYRYKGGFAMVVHFPGVKNW